MITSVADYMLHELDDNTTFRSTPTLHRLEESQDATQLHIPELMDSLCLASHVSHLIANNVVFACNTHVVLYCESLLRNKEAEFLSDINQLHVKVGHESGRRDTTTLLWETK